MPWSILLPVAILIGDLERERPRLRIVALKRGEDALRITPDAAAVIRAGDLLIVFGERASLEQLAQLAQGRAPGS